MSNETRNIFESLHNSIVFDSKDWSLNKRDAWIYGIVVGWCGEDDKENERIFQEFNNSFGWDIDTWNRLQTMHNEFLKFKEINLREITECIARNCVAWDTSKDKTESLLPEVAVFTNPYLYKKLTGEKYSYRGACNKFHIGQ